MEKITTLYFAEYDLNNVIPNMTERQLREYLFKNMKNKKSSQVVKSRFTHNFKEVKITLEWSDN